MDKINIEINKVLSNNARLLLKNLLRKSIRSILIYGSNKNVSVADSSHSTAFYCKEIDIIVAESNSIFKSTRITQILEEDYEFGEYASLKIGNSTITKVNLESMYSLCQNHFEIPIEYTIESIEVYGLYSHNLTISDNEFPERKTIYNVDTDCMLKINFSSQLSIIIQSKGGSLVVHLNKDAIVFSDYVKMTQTSWGLEYGYFYKYIID